MAQMCRVTANWTGFLGAPGYTNFYFRDFTVGPVDQAMADGAVAKLDIWLDAVAQRIPPSVTLLIDPTVEAIEETDGSLQGFFNTTPDTARVGASTGNYSGASGAVVNWYTDVVRNGRRIRGRSFIVPLGTTSYESDGTIAAATLTGLRSASATLLNTTGTGDLGVWSRPSSPGASDGVWALAISSTVPDKAVVLRSRRQ